MRLLGQIPLLTSRTSFEDIVGNIHTADLIVADLTGLNPNVMYELGIAHGLDKPVIMVAQDLRQDSVRHTLVSSPAL